MEKTRSFFEKDTRKLIQAVTGLQENDENFPLCLDFALTNFVSHQYIDENWFKTRERINGLCEKFHIHNEFERADSFRSLSAELLNVLDRLNVSEKTTYYAVLSLLTRLCGSVGKDNESEWMSSDSDGKKLRSSDEDINWGEYLKQKYVDTHSLSESDSEETWTESDEDSLTSSVYVTFPPVSSSTDSGIEVTPDSAYASYPPLKPFRPYQEPGPPGKPVQWPMRYWLPQYQTTKLPTSSSSSTSSFTKLWESQLAAKNPVYTPGTNLVFTEAVVIRELLWMLNGMKGTYLFEWRNNRFEVRKHFHLSHLTEHTLQALLLPLCQYGNKAASLHDFIISVSCRGRTHYRSQVLEAYAYGLEHFLNQYSSQLTSYEQKVVNQEEALTILQIVGKLKPCFDNLDFLHYVHTNLAHNVPDNGTAFVTATVLLDSLWRLLSEHGLWMSNSCHLKMLFVLILTALRPYLSMVESVTMRGSLSDPFSEFFIIRNQTISHENENFWSSVLSLRDHPKELSSNFFLQPAFENCLFAGRSMEVLRLLECYYETENFTDIRPDHLFNEILQEFLQICKNFERTLAGEKSEAEDLCVAFQRSVSMDSWFALPTQQFDPASKEKSMRELMTQHLELQEKSKKPYTVYDNHIKQCEDVAAHIHSVSLLPLTSALEECLLFSIDKACTASNVMLLNALKEKHDLMTHLAVMKKYFLMEAGDVMFTFYTEIFDKIFDHSPWQDESDLNGALKASLSVMDPESADRLHISVEEVVEDEKAPLKQLDALFMNYQVDWPITVVLSQEIQDGYCQIFHFLLQIKCAKYTLDELYCTPLKNTVCHRVQSLKRHSNHRIHPTQIVHAMYILRMKLLYFVNGFHSYVMTRILHSSGLELKEKLDDAKSVDDILKSHRQYLVSLFERCLLDSKLPYLREQIQRVLNLTLKFQAIWKAGVDRVWLRDLEQIEEDFSASVNFLTSYLKKRWKSGENLHLEALASSILTDTHMIQLFSEK